MEELSPHEFFALKEIGLTGQTGKHTLVWQLLQEKIIADVGGGFLELTSKGRSLLVRGSPLLWDIAF